MSKRTNLYSVYRCYYKVFTNKIIPILDSGSDVSNSDIKQTNNKNNPSKRTRTFSDNFMEEDYVTDSAADAGGNIAAPSAPGSVASGTDASMHALKDKETSLLDASPNKDIMDTNDTSPLSLDTPTISILRRYYQAAAAPNAFPEFVKKYPTNRAMIDAVNNLLLETYHSYTGRTHMSGSGDLKRLVIHFNLIKERDTCFSLRHDDLADHRSKSEKLGTNRSPIRYLIGDRLVTD
ncbi:hypothetical protein GLOIN_2v1774957 [Rhizophagus irregularis DAOM 181602=DAOM 197198]|nr:hypothetical protein GLOIN_2v1774957 [Rhizophagus irregularis DAOM 181602=DAOM 197198]